MSTVILNEFKALSTAEKVQLVEDLWDIIVETNEDIGLTPGQRAMLDRELAEHQRNPDEGVTFAELKAQIIAGRK